MSFPRYPEYEETGIEWLGQIPKHWEGKALRHVISDFYSGGTPESGDERFWAERDTGVAWVSIADMTRAAWVVETDRYISHDGMESKRLRVLPAGAVLFSMYASLGKVAVLGIPAAINQAIIALTPNEKLLDSSFLRYWLISLEPYLFSLSSSNTQNNLNAAKVRALPACVPSRREQSEIAAFLDHETAKIDALVAEQEQLIALLKEKRQAVISHAVTKGLNPDAPMKDSGIEWVGPTPTHWQVFKLSREFTIGSGTTPRSDNPAFYDGGTIPWVNTGDLNDGDINSPNRCVTQVALELHTSLKIYGLDSVAIAMYGATIGKLGLFKITGCVNQACCVFSSPKRVLARFLFFWFLAMRQQIISLASGGGQPNISQETLRTLFMSAPTIEEQTKIVEFLTSRVSDFDTLISEAERGIELLQERRTALISAAVTGQIDVRGWAARSTS